MDWVKDTNNEKIHPTQKPVSLLKALIQIFTDEGDVVIDPVAGSGSTLVAAIECNRKAFGVVLNYTQRNDGGEYWGWQENQKIEI